MANGNSLISGKSLTKKVLMVASGGLLLYEAWTLINEKTDDKISDTVWDLSKYPFFSFACGVLAGHFFWQENK
jgi:hypothetical protein